MVILHADAVAQNSPSRIRTGRINRDDADGLLLLAIVLGKLIDQGTLA